MKNPLKVVGAGIAVLFALSACAAPNEAGADTEHTVTSEFNQELHNKLPQEIRDAGVISVAGETNQPWRIIDANGNVSGFQPDILEEFSEILGVKFQSDMVSGLPSVKLGIQSGRNDLGFGPLLNSEQTREELVFVDYTIGRPSFLYSVETDPIGSVLDLCGQTISHLEGSVAFDLAIETIDEECTTAGESAVSTLPLADINAVILSLESGRADFGGMGAHQAAYSELQESDKFQKYISSDDEFVGDSLSMGFDPSQGEFAEVMYETWQIVFENGIYAELMEKYNMTEIMIDEPSLYLDAVE